MRKFVLILFSSLLLVACSSGDDGMNSNNGEGSVNESENEEESGIEVDKGLLNVEMTLPAMFFEGDELEAIEKEMEEDRNAKVTKNDDGSVTVKMSKQEHKQLINEMKEDVIQSIDEIVQDDEFSSINDIHYNKDFSEIDIIVDRQGFEESFDAFALISVGFSTLFYQLVDGKDIEKDKVMMNIVDEATDEMFEEIVFPDVFEEMEEGLDKENAG